MDPIKGFFRRDGSARTAGTITPSEGGYQIADTSTSAIAGDICRFETGPLAFQEFTVLSASTNSFVIASKVAPVATNTFYILAETSARLGSDGSLQTSSGGGGTSAVSQAGRAKANAPVRNDYSSVNVTTAAYVQLVASTTSATNEIEIFDSSGQTLALAVGAAASEVIQMYIFPGGNGRVPLAIAAGSRVSIKAISATASAGEININFYT